jgi:hypothetical protein
MIITTHAGDCLNLTDHVDQPVRLGQEDFRSPENERFLMKFGRCITLAPGPNAPAAILVRLRDWLVVPELWSHVGYLWAEVAETAHTAG